MSEKIKKTKTMRIRLTEAEWEYITSIARDRNITESEALRWLIHQSILLTITLIENPQVIMQAKKALKELPHMRKIEVTPPQTEGSP
jgi:hypothetical protein